MPNYNANYENLDSDTAPVAPKFRHGSGYQKEKSNYEAAKRKYDASQLSQGKTAGNPGQILSGSASEQQGQLAGLNLAALGYGQGLGQTGEDIQRVRELQRQRTGQSGGDPVSAAIMGQTAGQVANTQRNLAASGVKGGVAAGAASQVERAGAADVAASLYGQQRQSIADERSLAGNTLSGTTALMQGEKAANVKQPSAPDAGGTLSICFGLLTLGAMSKELYAKEANVIKDMDPKVIQTYLMLSTPISERMKTSPVLASMAASMAIPWVEQMTGERPNFKGKAINAIGMPILKIVSKVI